MKSDDITCSSFHNSRLKCKEDKKYKCFESYFLSFGSDATVKLVINAGNRMLFKLMFNLLSWKGFNFYAPRCNDLCSN